MISVTVNALIDARDNTRSAFEGIDIAVRQLQWNLVAHKLRQARRLDVGHEMILPERAREVRR